MNYEIVYFNEEVGLWFKPGRPWDGVKAATYPEAFEKFYGHAPAIPPVKREQRRNEAA